MSVYIEYVIIDNFFITSLIAFLSYRFLSLRVQKIRLMTASAIGTVAAVFYPMLELHAAIIILLKIALAILLSLVLFYKKCKVIHGGFIFVISTISFGGFLFAIGLMVHGSATKALTLPVSQVPIGLILAGATIAYIVFKRFFLHSKRVAVAKNYTMDIQIDIFGKTVEGVAFLDTGNRLYDEKSMLPIIVLNSKAALKVLDEHKFASLIQNNLKQIDETAHYIEFATLSNKNSKILVLKPLEVRLYYGQDEHRIKEVMIGLSFSRFGDSVMYDAIIPPSIIPTNSY